MRWIWSAIIDHEYALHWNNHDWLCLHQKAGFRHMLAKSLCFYGSSLWSILNCNMNQHLWISTNTYGLTRHLKSACICSSLPSCTWGKSCWLVVSHLFSLPSQYKGKATSDIGGNKLTAWFSDSSGNFGVILYLSLFWASAPGYLYDIWLLPIHSVNLCLNS